MKTFTLAMIGLIGYVQSLQGVTTNYLNTPAAPYLGSGNIERGCDHERKVHYDYTCRNERLGDALQNDITIYGPNIVLVNLDNRCAVRKFEREGVFLQTGDLLIVTGREFTCALQSWDEPYFGYYDYDVLFPGLDYDMPLLSAPGYRQEIVILEAVGSGKTNYRIDLTWGYEVVRDVNIDVYVDQQPGLVVATPRHDCGCKCDDRY
jgi:hypothetical protein